jgi:DnaA-homolog protein
VQQLPLNIRLPLVAQFSNFVVGDNQVLLSDVQQALLKLQGQIFYLWGARGCGKTHLLKAACQRALNLGWATSYLPLAATDVQAEELSSLRHMQVVCLDDIDHFMGDRGREEAFFHLFNYIREAGGCLIVSASCSPAQLKCALPDLQSRLTWGASYQVMGLDDAAKVEVLQGKAGALGLDLEPEVARYLMTRAERDMHQLVESLQVLDSASLASQRRLTIPFVKQVLGI